jgi:spermidine synthase
MPSDTGSIEISEKQGVRYLHFGSEWILGAMRIARPWALELEYTRELMLPLLLRPSTWPASVLQVGLGSASITRFLHRYRPQARITVVEIAPRVVAAARQFFKLPEDSLRLRVEIADGFDYLATNRRRFDLLQLDAYDADARAGMLDTAPFYHLCRERLADNGLVAINILTGRRGIAASLARLREAFGDEVAVLAPSEAGNTVAIAARKPFRLDAKKLRASAAALKAQGGLDLTPTLDRME